MADKGAMVKDDDRDYTQNKAAHSDQRNKAHEDHAAAAKKRALQKLLTSYEILQEFTGYSAFKSKVIELGGGNNWVRKDGKLVEVEGDEWLDAMFKIAAQNERHHVRTQGPTKVYYRSRKLRDRKTLSPKDKRPRPKTDLRRFTIDLRPDHSRAIQKLLAKDYKDLARALVDNARDECIRQFERRYGRDVRAVAEHTDSGQLHFDLWHTGIRTVEVNDSCADVKNGKIVNGEKKVIRRRTKYKAYGVGVGVASWNRHRRALDDAGIKPDTILNKDTLDTITKMTALKKKETGEPPRDIGMYESLDRFMAFELAKVEPEITKEALDEYVQWLKMGYSSGKLGKRGLTEREKKMATKIKQLSEANETLINELGYTQHALNRLKKLLKGIKEFLARIKKSKGLMALMEKDDLKKTFNTVFEEACDPAITDEEESIQKQEEELEKEQQ